MPVRSSGDSNRVAGQDFHENNVKIDSYDGRNTINIAIPSDGSEPRPLVKAQRKELNNLVAAVSDCGGDEAYVIWQKVHAEVGVSSIDEMTANQYKAALSFLQAMLGRCKDKDASKALVSLLLRNSEDCEVRQKLIRYCNINFGTGRLNDLTRPQLQLALSWLDQETNMQPTRGCTPITQRLQPLELMRSYPKEMGAVFFVGLVLGILLI